MRSINENTTFISEFSQLFPEKGLVHKPVSSLGGRYIGGPVEAIISVESLDELKKIVAIAVKYRLPYHVIGCSTSTLCSEIGYRGLVIINNLKSITWDQSKSQAIVGSGLELTTLINIAATSSLGGLEMFSAIPGSVSGMMFSNTTVNKFRFLDNIKDITILYPEEDELKIEVISETSQIEQLIKNSQSQLTGLPIVVSMKIQFRRLDHEEIIRRIHKVNKDSINHRFKLGYLWKNDLLDYPELVKQITKIKSDIYLNRANPNLIDYRSGVGTGSIYKWIINVERIASELQIILERNIKIMGYWPDKEENL